MTPAIPSRPPPEVLLRAYESARLRLARMSVAGGASLGEVLARAAETAAQTLAVERVGIWLFIEERRAIRCFHLYERAKDAHSEGAVLRAADFPSYFRALEERRDIPAADAPDDPLTHELREAYLEPLGIQSMLDAPVFREGKVVGVVCHEHTVPRVWNAEERDFAASVADRIASAFEEAARLDAEARARSLEELSVETGKMEALGRLAAGVAHDFRNLLTVIIGFAHEIRRVPGASERTVGAAREIEKAAGRGSALVRDLLAFGREESQPTRVVDLAEVVETLDGVLRTALGGQYDCQIRCVRPLGRVLIDRTQLERMVMNLVLNARDAMPSGGTVSIDVREVRVDDDDGSSGVYVVLEVRDTGIGMDAETRARIFEPFFTTKPPGLGTGIGLSVVYRIVERAGGFVHAESELGRGTRFRVYLPRVAAES